MRVHLLLGVTLLVACGDARTSSHEGDVAAVPTYTTGHFALGATATPAQIAAWNTDIGPEGLELPAGRGSAADGAKIFAAQCAACHGANGQGMEPVYPALIGRPAEVESFDFASNPKSARTIGNYWSHATTLYDYIRRAMPLYTPGSLSADETYAVTAYLLAANRVISDTAVLDAAALRAVVMPARDRFVADDRSPSRP